MKEIYEEHFVDEEEQQMDTTEGTKGAKGIEQTGIEQTGKAGPTPGSMIKVKKLEKPRVSKPILPYEPPVMRCRSA